MRLLILVRTLGGGTMGRAYSFGLLAEELGWDHTIAAPRPAPLWKPLNGTGVEEHCEVLPRVEDVVRRSVDHDVVIALKPWPHTYGRARRAQSLTGTPVVLDIDDPDLERQLDTATWRGRLRHVNPRLVPDRRHPLEVRRLARHVGREPVTASNPALADRYGATVLPHARLPRPSGVTHVGVAPVIGFIGTHQRHKGLPVLRRAVRQLADEGFRLVASGSPPPDAEPWEVWLETTTVAEGLAAIDACDVLAIPSLDTLEARAQLPAKLIDAMISGRAVVASDLPPIRWASGGAARLVRPGSVPDLVTALRQMADPAVRQPMGDQLRDRALTRFTPEVLAAHLRDVVERAASGSAPPSRPPRPRWRPSS